MCEITDLIDHMNAQYWDELEGRTPPTLTVHPEPLIRGIPLSCWSLQSLLELPSASLDVLEPEERALTRTYLNCAVWYSHTGAHLPH